MQGKQFTYLEELRKLSGYTVKVAKWREESFEHLGNVLLRHRILTYRDEPFPQDLLDKAAAEFKEVRQKKSC